MNILDKVSVIIPPQTSTYSSKISVHVCPWEKISVSAKDGTLISAKVKPSSLIGARIPAPKKISATMSGSEASKKYYDGVYKVVPKAFESQVLLTEGKFMKQNVVCEKIPSFQTSNDSGGSTFYIGDEI